jgi:hypothetical protein
MIPEDIKTEVKILVTKGLDLHLFENSGQCYIRVGNLEAPSPPWNEKNYDILIAIPAAYSDAALDAFYLSLPYFFNGGAHPRVNGGILDIEGNRWQLTSWHYPGGKPWRRGQDDLDSHIAHCRGFFFHRGALNGY